MYSETIKKLAKDLREKGASITTLSKKFNIAKSTISLWVRDIELPLELRKYLTSNSIKGRVKGQQILKAKREIEQNIIEAEARKVLSSINTNNIDLAQFIAATIFWCEGSKRSLASVCFTNSDPALIKLFLNCLRNGFDTEESKFRGLLHLHEYHNEKRQKQFWSQITGFPKSQFSKSYLKPHTKIRKRDNYQGCISIRYYDSKVARKLDAIYHILAKSIGP